MEFYWSAISKTKIHNPKRTHRGHQNNQHWATLNLGGICCYVWPEYLRLVQVRFQTPLQGRSRCPVPRHFVGAVPRAVSAGRNADNTKPQGESTTSSNYSPYVAFWKFGAARWDKETAKYRREIRRVLTQTTSMACVVACAVRPPHEQSFVRLDKNTARWKKETGVRLSFASKNRNVTQPLVSADRANEDERLTQAAYPNDCTGDIWAPASMQNFAKQMLRLP